MHVGKKDEKRRLLNIICPCNHNGWQVTQQQSVTGINQALTNIKTNTQSFTNTQYGTKPHREQMNNFANRKLMWICLQVRRPQNHLNVGTLTGCDKLRCPAELLKLNKLKTLHMTVPADRGNRAAHWDQWQ